MLWKFLRKSPSQDPVNSRATQGCHFESARFTAQGNLDRENVDLRMDQSFASAKRRSDQTLTKTEGSSEPSETRSGI